MPQNRIQFQHGMSLSEFIDTFGTEAKCEAALERARWPTGFVCPACGGHEHSRFLADGRRYWQCAHCRTPSSVRSGTLFHASKLPLTQWFQAIYLVTQNKNNISALSLKRHLGVAYATAWRVKHKLLEAMAQRESARLPRGAGSGLDLCLPAPRRGPRSETRCSSPRFAHLRQVAWMFGSAAAGSGLDFCPPLTRLAHVLGLGLAIKH